MNQTEKTKTMKTTTKIDVKEKVKAIDKEVNILYTLYRVLLSSLK